MSEKLSHIAGRLRYWLAERNIDPHSFVFIINVANRNAAAHLDSELHRELGGLDMVPDIRVPLDLREGFELYGLKFRLESPLHAEPWKHVIFSPKFPKPE